MRTNGFRPVAACAMALCHALGFAQTTYRCGNTFSQTPCATDAKPSRAISPAAPDSAPASGGGDLCTSLAPAALHLADPESARIRSVTKVGTEAIEYAGKPTVAHRFDMVINQKNSFGAYVGDRTYVCYLSEDDHRLLKAEPKSP